MAKRLAIDGFGAVMNYLNDRAEVEQVVAELKGIDGNAIAIQGDVSIVPDSINPRNEQAE